MTDINKRGSLTDAALSAADGSADNTAKPDFSCVPWRDVFCLKIADENLRSRVEQTLDFFEKARFKGPLMTKQGKLIRMLKNEGLFLPILASYLHKVKNYAGKVEGMSLMEYIGNESDQENTAEISSFAFAKEGKLIIHDMPALSYDEQNMLSAGGAMHKMVPVADGRISYFSLMNKSAVPVGIALSNDYLRGSSYEGVDGKTYPVTIEGFMAANIGDLLSTQMINMTDVSRRDHAHAIQNVILRRMGVPESKSLYAPFTSSLNRDYVSYPNRHRLQESRLSRKPGLK